MMTRPPAAPSRVLVAALAAALLLAACAEDEARPAGGGRFRTAMDAVCQAETYAEAKDYRASLDVFLGEAHAYLHRLAALVEREDREVAAALFEAKQQVEETYRDPFFYGPELMVRRFRDLEEAMRRAASVLGYPEATCAA
jgi:hypothetical protein